MDALDLFFKKYNYKFDKGYPDMNNEKDVLLLESLLNKLNINVSLEETALTPSELNKDATFKGGNKVPRIEILIQKIQKGDELELNDGSKFKVINTKEVLSQLQGKTKIDKSIDFNKLDKSKINYPFVMMKSANNDNCLTNNHGNITVQPCYALEAQRWMPM